MKYKKSTKGFILKKNFYKDTSVFLEIFTLNFGKRSFFIKNFKKSKKINSAFLNIGSEIEFNFSERLDVGNISEINFVNGFENLDEEDLRYLSYYLGIISKFLHDNEKNSDIYLFLQKFFLVFKNFLENEKKVEKKLEKFCDKNILLKIFFEVKIFTKLGYLRNLENKFLKVLQKNEIEKILNLQINKYEEARVFKIFDDFLLENGCEKILKIIEKNKK